MSRFCANCGNPLPEAAAFCQHCGAAAHQPTVYVNPRVPGRGFGIASMVLGIISLLYIGYPFFNFLRFLGRYDPEPLFGMLLVLFWGIFAVMAILAICFSLVARSHGYHNGIQKSGLILGIIAISCYTTWLMLLMVG